MIMSCIVPHYGYINRLLVSISNTNYKQPASGYGVCGIIPKLEFQVNRD